jgi:hypothetical protein
MSVLLSGPEAKVTIVPTPIAIVWPSALSEVVEHVAGDILFPAIIGHVGAEGSDKLERFPDVFGVFRDDRLEQISTSIARVLMSKLTVSVTSWFKCLVHGLCLLSSDNVCNAPEGARQTLLPVVEAWLPEVDRAVEWMLANDR